VDPLGLRGVIDLLLEMKTAQIRSCPGKCSGRAVWFRRKDLKLYLQNAISTENREVMI
jgi:hypothetical protein